jgi:hypothetical protein
LNVKRHIPGDEAQVKAAQKAFYFFVFRLYVWAYWLRNLGRGDHTDGNQEGQ